LETRADSHFSYHHRVMKVFYPDWASLSPGTQVMGNHQGGLRQCASCSYYSPSYWLRPRQVLPRATTQTGSFSLATLTSVPITARIDWMPAAEPSPALAQLHAWILFPS